MVFYRKYRPQSLRELYGQEIVKLTLQNAFETGRLAHAYLFCGPRGTGKTSTARVLAKMVNCEKTGKYAPCNSCSSCISITDGSSLDLIEIDAASNRGIDDIREIREKIKLSPTSSRKKVYIVDEVHMLSTEAFNALLKTLEEPPSHTIFILATTEAHKIPETILSRVQRLDFKLATKAELVDVLGKVAKSEEIAFDKEALLLVAEKSEGSFRDAIKILDQLSSMGNKITLELVEKSLKSSNFTQQVNLIETLIKKDAKKALDLVIKAFELGVNTKEYILSFMEILRMVMLMKHGLKANLKEDLGSDKYEKLISVAKTLDTEQILIIFENFQKAFEKIKVSIIPSLPIEIAVVESCQIKNNLIKTEYQIASVELVQDFKTTSLEEKKENIVYQSQPDSSELVVLKDKWNYILETIKPYNFSLEAMLKLVKVMDCTDNQIILEVPYSFHQRILEAPKSRNLLESVLTDVFGRSMKVVTVVGKKPVRDEDIANIEVAAEDDIIRIASEIFNSDTIT